MLATNNEGVFNGTDTRDLSCFLFLSILLPQKKKEEKNKTKISEIENRRKKRGASCLWTYHVAACVHSFSRLLLVLRLGGLCSWSIDRRRLVKLGFNLAFSLSLSSQGFSKTSFFFSLESAREVLARSRLIHSNTHRKVRIQGFSFSIRKSTQKRGRGRGGRHSWNF